MRAFKEETFLINRKSLQNQDYSFVIIYQYGVRKQVDKPVKNGGASTLVRRHLV